MAKKQLLIVGARGLIGSACAAHFGGREEWELLLPTRRELNLLNYASVSAYFAAHPIDQIICAAGVSGGIAYNLAHPADLITRNLQMQLHLFEAAHQKGVERALFFGSSCMYPKKAHQPMEESSLLTGPLEESSLPYALAKLSGLEMAKAYNRQHQKSRFAVLIPNSVYGPGAHFTPTRGHVLTALITRFNQAKEENAPSLTLWGSGRAKREFLFAADLARAAQIVLNAPSPPLPLNVGSGEEISIEALATCIARCVGYRGHIKWDPNQIEGAPRKYLDSRRIRELGWEPQVSLEEGIAITYNAYLKEKGHALLP